MNDPLGEDLEDAPTERALAASEPERPDGGTDRKREANASGGRADGPSVEASAASLAADALRGDSLKEALAQSLADTLAETLAKTLVAIDDKSGFIDKASKDESDDHAVEDDPADGPPNAADAERIDRPRREVSARLDAAETGATGRPIFEAIMPTVSFRGDEAMFEDRAAGPDRRGDEALRADTSADADDADAEALRVESGGGEEAGQEAGDEAGAEDAAPTAADADAGLSAAESDWIATETPVAAGFEQDVDDAALDAPSMSTDDEFGEDASSEPHRLGLGLVRAVARAREAAVAYRDGEQTGEQGSLTTEQEAEPQEPVDIRAGIDSGVEAAERGFPIHDIDAALDDDANNDDDIDHEAINQEALDQEAIDHEAFDEDDVAPPAEIGGGLSVALDRDVSLRGEPIAFDALADAAPDTEEEEEYDEAPSDVAAPPLEEQTRMVEAMLFASETPLSTAELGARMPIGCDPAVAVRRLEQSYETRGVRVVRVAGKWAFRTAPDLAYLMTSEAVEQRKLSKAAIETLAIIAYHQPVTRAEIEEIRPGQRVEGHDRSLDGARVDQARPPPANAGSSGDLHHHRDVPRPFRLGEHEGSAGTRRAASGWVARQPTGDRAESGGGRGARDRA